MPALPFGHHKEVDVNLLPKDAFSQSPVGKFLDWALSTGRYIVVFTEMVVILTFLQRFSLDRRLSELNEQIFARQAVLSSYERVEDEARAIQRKGSFLKDLEEQVEILAVLDFLNQETPREVSFDDLSVNDQLVIIKGVAFSQDALEDFIDIIKTYPGLTDVNLEIISQTEAVAGLEFDLSLDFELEEEVE